MAMTNAERQRAWRIRQRESEGRRPRRRGERAAQIAGQDGCCARTVYRSVHYARAIDTIAAAYPDLTAQIRQRRVRLGHRIVGQRLAVMLAGILREDPEGFAEHALPLFVDRWTGIGSHN